MPRTPAPSVPSPSIRLASRVGRITSSAIRDLLEVAQRPEVISLAGGLPAPETFPAAEVTAAVAELLAGSADVLQYSTTQGHPPLRELAAARHGAGDGQVVITSGSQQALDLLARALLEPGDEVAVADPAYMGATQAFGLAGARLVGIPGDAGGMRVDLLADRLAAGRVPAVVYVVANFDNPTGSTLSAERRIQLAALADRYGFVVIEDDPYGELRFSGQAPAPVASYSDRVVSLGTVSKTLCPGLRVGYLVAPEPLTQAVCLLKQATDLHTSTLAQHVVHRVLTAPGFVEAQRARLRSLYAERASAMAAGLRAELGDRIRFGAPEGGMFIWAELSDGTDTARLLPAAIEHGVAFVPGAVFAVGTPAPSSMRLSFATAGPSELAEGARRLRLACDAVGGSGA